MRGPLWLASALLLAACDQGPAASLSYEGLAACQDPSHGTEAWFQDTMEPEFFGPYCSYCHQSDRTGDQRHGAPATLNFDDFASATSRSGRVWERVARAEMPPLGALPSQEGYALLLDFLNCTTAPATAGFQATLGACEDPTITYADAQPVFQEHCTGCHDSALAEGADRSFAPPNRNWDQPASIREAGPDLLWRRLFAGEMPPGALTPLLEADPEGGRALYRYLSCGAPD